MKRLVSLAFVFLLSACVPPTIPPIVFVPPSPVPPVVEAPAAKPKATLAFQIVDEASGAAIATAFATFADGTSKQANEDGYLAFEREVGTYAVTFEATDYATSNQRFQVETNRQFTVKLKSTKPLPPTPPATVPPPVVAPPVIVPPVVIPPAPIESGVCPVNGDRLSCVRAVAAKYPELLQINTYDSCLRFTQRVLAELGPDWGHVGKGSGEDQAVPVGFTGGDYVGIDGKMYHVTGVSHDAIKHRLTGQVVDLLGNASANSDPRPEIHGPATPQWAIVPPENWRDRNPFVPAVPVR